MRSSALSALSALLLLTPSAIASPHPHASSQAGFEYNGLQRRWECGGETCGWSGQLCCAIGTYCYTDANDQAQCGSTASGYWELFTTTYVLTDLQTITSTGSNLIETAAVAVSTATPQCHYALNETPCGDICCAADQKCASAGSCVYNPLVTTTGITPVATDTAVVAAVPPVLGTSSSISTTTTTVDPTMTAAFIAPVATGANITMTASGDGGLSGGAIAGIVIGVLLGLALLALVCFYCCIKGLCQGLLALFGIGGRKGKRRTEVDEYERRSHHRHGSDGRKWYGAAAGPAPSRHPSRAPRRDHHDSHTGRNLLGVGAGLTGLWALLGMKRNHRASQQQRRHPEKYSDSSSRSSNYYTSTSKSSLRSPPVRCAPADPPATGSSSSDDRRTRHTQRSMGRSMGRSLSRR